MAAPPARARADYDYLIKLLLIGDSGTLLDRKLFSRIMFSFCFSYYLENQTARKCSDHFLNLEFFFFF